MQITFMRGGEKQLMGWSTKSGFPASCRALTVMTGCSQSASADQLQAMTVSRTTAVLRSRVPGESEPRKFDEFHLYATDEVTSPLLMTVFAPLFFPSVSYQQFSMTTS